MKSAVTALWIAPLAGLLLFGPHALAGQGSGSGEGQTDTLTVAKRQAESSPATQPKSSRPTLTSLAEQAPMINLRILDDRQVSVIHLQPHFSTTLILTGQVSSINVGDPALFQAEHSPVEPHLIFVKPLTENPAESNLTVTTVSGQTTSLMLRSGLPGPIHFVVRFESLNTSFLVDEGPRPTMMVPNTISLTNPGRFAEDVGSGQEGEAPSIAQMLRQQQRSLPGRWVGKRLKVSIGELYQRGQHIYLLFAFRNPSNVNLEILPPQLQLSTKVKKRGLARAAQLPVEDYLLSHRRLRPGQRGDGVVIFTKPVFKQSKETYYLQVAESSAVDLPTLAPINLQTSKLLQGGQ